MNFCAFLKKWDYFWFHEVDSVRLKLFQIGMGISLFIYLTSQWHWKEEWLTTVGYHLSPELFKSFYVLPVFPLIPIAWLGMIGYFWRLSVLSLILGIGGRISIFLCLIVIGYPTVLDPISSFTLNLLFIASFLMLSLTKSTGGLLRLHKVDMTTVMVERMLQVTLITCYFFSGWKKAVVGNWLEHTDVLFTQVQGHYRTDLAAWLIGVLPPQAWFLMQLSSLVFELGAPYLFFHPKSRPWVVAYGILFHVAIV